MLELDRAFSMVVLMIPPADGNLFFHDRLFVDELPLDPQGKILQRRLRALQNS